MKIIKLSLIIFLSLFTNIIFALHLFDKPTPYLGDADLPSRTPPIEIGDPMLGPGKISCPHIVKSTGAIINSRLWIFGTVRTALQAFRAGSAPDSSEWANRIDLFANLQLTETDRILLHIRPEYTTSFRESRDEFNANVEQLFFEGDLGDFLPHWQDGASGPHDIGITIGRQQIFFQDGIFIDDFVDAVALTQNSQTYPGISNLQVTTYLGVHNIDRDDGLPDDKAYLIGLHFRSDIPKHTLDFDFAYVDSRECHHQDYYDDKSDLLVFAVSGVQRIGRWGVTLRALSSFAAHRRTRQSGDGLLATIESNREVGCHHDIFYINAAAAIGEFTSVARDESVAGPLGRVGILFASAGIGNLGSALESRANHCVVGAVGYQKFIDFNWQGIIEVGTRINTCTSIGDTVAIGARLQRGIGRRSVLRFDAFVGGRNTLDSIYGLRTEILVKL